jgi:hypothetical protein
MDRDKVAASIESIRREHGATHIWCASLGTSCWLSGCVTDTLMIKSLLILERSCAHVMASMCFIVHSSFFVACRLCVHLGWLIPSEMVTGPTCNYSLSQYL